MTICMVSFDENAGVHGVPEQVSFEGFDSGQQKVSSLGDGTMIAPIDWQLAEDATYKAEIGPWSIVLLPDDETNPREWFAECTYEKGALCDLLPGKSLERAKEEAEHHAERIYDFRDFHWLDAETFARVIHDGALLGLGAAWRDHDPDTEDGRFRRCVIAGRAALDTLWNPDSPVEPGEALEASDEMIYEIYTHADSMAYSKITRFYEAIDEGINTSMWRSQCRRSEAAARRATASLFGLVAAENAQHRMDRENAEQAVAWEREREVPKPDRAAMDEADPGGEGGMDRAAARERERQVPKPDRAAMDEAGPGGEGCMDMEAFEAELDALGM